MYHRVLQGRHKLDRFAKTVSQDLAHLQKDKERIERQRDNARRAAKRLYIEARQKQQISAILSHAASQKREQRLENELELLQELVKKAQLDERIWHAAGPLRDVMHAEQHVAMLEARLAARQKEHEPLHSIVQESAYAYAAALSARIEQLCAEEEHWTQTKAEYRRQARGAKAERKKKHSSDTRLSTRDGHFTLRLHT